MLRNYFNIVIRNLLKQKLFSFINVFGLSVSITICILVVLYIQNELSYDQFHSRADRIYRPYTYARAGEREATSVHTPFIMGKQLKENYAEVTAYTIITEFNALVTVDKQSIEENIHIVSPDFFQIFDFEPLYGITKGKFDDPANIIITREMAEKYFGRVNVVNEVMDLQIGGEKQSFRIQAVLDEIPSNSIIRFSFLINDHHLKDIFPEPMLTSWHMITGETYLVLEEGADPDALQPKFTSLVEQVLGEDLERMEFSIFLQPLTDIHLNTDLPSGNAPVSDPRYIYILSGIAVLILIVASINFIMLSLGRSFMRGKEIGIRKSTGATRTQIVLQFLGESVFIAFLGLILGIGWVYLSLPWFNKLSGTQLSFSFDLSTIFIFIGITMLTGLLAGIYPALVMSGYNPVKILRGNLKVGKGNNTFGSILVTGQFILFIILIGCTLIMKSQLNYLQNKNLGFDKENVMVVPVNTAGAKGVRDVVSVGFEKSRIFEDALKQIPEIESTAIASHTFEPGTWTNIGYEDEDGQTKSFYYNTVDPGYLPTLDIKLVAGRNFSPDIPSDRNRSIIVNETFVKEFGLDRGVGERIPSEQFEDHEIIGVVEDFHIQSLHTKIEPLVLSMNVDIAFSGAQNVNIGSSVRPKLFIRLRENEVSKGLVAVEKAFKEVYPDDTFDYEFIDERLKEQYQREQNLGRVVTSASILAVIIGCLGLFGLSILSFNSRLKEISIRKVLGASASHILFVLSRKFIYLLLIAIVISIPVTLNLMQNWLDDFQYKISIEPGIFILAGSISILIILFTLSYQALGAIKANPAETLRNE